MKYGLGASRVGSFPEMVQEGVTVALGSDSANWSNVFDVGFQAYLAATIHRESRMAYPLITAEDVLEMATVNGAKVMRQEGKLGVLAKGHKADIVIDRRKRAEWYPGLDLVYDLVYAGQSKDVDTVIIDGQVILKDGHFVGFDEQAALAEMHGAALALAKRCGHPPAPRWPVIE
jgi:cytosine/adenosine deaminase-related metal-dependent hydrolase